MIMVRLFGMLKSMAGASDGTLALDLPEGSSVRDLIETLERQHPQIWELIAKKKVVVSVNQEIAQEATPIRETDEIALLPPFAGGASGTSRGA
ncbi:MAG: MoaD/ThiS family protein [Nitrospirae bacterium]|nr:MAG: MoaD/ThiS family protein [Nitrospirota bacterium]